MKLQKLLEQALKLKRWLNAWRICDFTKNKEHWRKYAIAAMQNADVELGSCNSINYHSAIRVMKQIDDVSMVWALEEIQYIEERNLLAGHLALIMEQFDVAESYFLRSTKPTEALDVRVLLHAQTDSRNNFDEVLSDWRMKLNDTFEHYNEIPREFYSQMRRDLLHWEKALQLANRLAPEQIPFISKEYAQQLEFM
ncbi:unnamed protein product [Anisakis simplex]|uniref:DYF-2 (inferred by orthology to a C. elegans protein) n=1 Tax=Anisakis simplex TaxID=6269 RepID=A0A0M3J9C5_ANISI|nr:unnamed protein product [Anisakis simplex]